ncbi:Interferon-induced transmembrane protein [Frankia sp. EI5c]|uniref:CD225/dispanin family protein n=1 Tax=Frankia sp. EI5c TaxID=683316 RepID=UPI0007C2EAC1|nr:CD225/dispanin family protein [Frankia sp. EI5c]OAA25636.1 Interferon-induced transmembrane protein [Frankia sp. EI5c]
MSQYPDSPQPGGNDPQWSGGGQPAGPWGAPQGGTPPPGGYGAPGQYPAYPSGPVPPAGYGAPGFGPPPPGGQPIPTYLWQSIVCTLLCCLPAGIAAIVFATRVQSRQQAGDIQGALEASRKAKTWTIVSFAVGLVGQLISLAVLASGS